MKTHLGRVLTKTGARDRTRAVVLAYETGLVVPGGGRRSRWGEVRPRSG